MPLTFGSLFAGIGGIDLGFEWAGMECLWQVENDPYCSSILAKHWPSIPRYGDIESIKGADLPSPDIICGGFPCQPVSHAGRRQGRRDSRWLWPQMARMVDEVRPTYVVVENVPGLLSKGGSEVLADLATMGFDAEWGVVSARDAGAPHRRERIWIVAFTHRDGRTRPRLSEEQGEGGFLPTGSGGSNRNPARTGSGPRKKVAYPDSRGRDGGSGTARARWGTEPADSDWWAVEPGMGRVAHGVPGRVDQLKALGNAVVPQVAAIVGRRVIEIANQSNRTLPH